MIEMKEEDTTSNTGTISHNADIKAISGQD